MVENGKVRHKIALVVLSGPIQAVFVIGFHFKLAHKNVVVGVVFGVENGKEVRVFYFYSKIERIYLFFVL